MVKKSKDSVLEYKSDTLSLIDLNHCSISITNTVEVISVLIMIEFGDIEKAKYLISVYKNLSDYEKHLLYKRIEKVTQK